MLTRKLREIRVALLLCGLGSFTAAFAARKPDKPDPSDTFFTNHTIPRIGIQLDEEALAALRNKFREYTKATVFERSNIWREIGIHLKGQD